MPLYEARITIKPAATQWRFEAEDIKKAKVVVLETVGSMIEDNVQADVVEVEE